MATSQQSCSRKRALKASESARTRRRRLPSSLRLHLLRGKLVPESGSGSGGAPMDEAVWSRLPDDLLWRVMVTVPAATRAQLHLVSREWRRVLASAEFRTRVVAHHRAARVGHHGAAAASGSGVVACVAGGGGSPSASSGEDGANSGGKSSNLAAVDVDLAFVPRGFWKSDDEFKVVAARAGLLCISNNVTRDEAGAVAPERTRYCVVNPLTRSCRLLPRLPFPPWGWTVTAAWVTVTGLLVADGAAVGVDFVWKTATCDVLLEEDAAAAPGRWVVADEPIARWRMAPGGPPCPAVAVCHGGTYVYYERRVHFRRASCSATAQGGTGTGTAAAPAPASTTTVTFDAPRPTEPGDFTLNYRNVALVAQQGTVFFVGAVEKQGAAPPMLCVVWRLVPSGSSSSASSRRNNTGMIMSWEVQGGLLMDDVTRFTQSRYAGSRRHHLCGAWGAGDWLCVEVGVKYIHDHRSNFFDWLRVMVGFSLDSGNWELLHDDERCHEAAQAFELKPDFFF